MLCYRDMTFCTFHEDCAKAPTCHRPLTDEVKRGAAEWWGGNDAPVALFLEKPACHEPSES